MKFEITIDGLNTEKGLDAFNGRARDYKRVLDIFHRDSVQKVKDIEKYLNNKDMKAYIICVHALKGSCISIGADSLAKMASDLEAAGKSNDILFIEVNTGKFLYELESLSVKLRDALEPSQITEALDTTKLFEDLAALAAAIEAINPSDIQRYVEAISQFAVSKDMGHDIEKILDNILTGDYGEAVRIINSILVRF